jgi:hypothetical protein
MTLKRRCVAGIVPRLKIGAEHAKARFNKQWWPFDWGKLTISAPLK